MRLSARILNNVSGVNAFDYAEAAEFTEGDAPTIYLQLIDLSQDKAEKGFVPAGRRYCPASGATLSVVLDNIDDSRKLTKIATQPYPTQDPSIWSVTLLSTDKIRGTANLKLTLTESSKTTYGFLSAGAIVSSMDGMTRL